MESVTTDPCTCAKGARCLRCIEIDGHTKRKVPFTRVIQGIRYRFDYVDEFRCRNCMRVTLSGSCGCSSMEPVRVGQTLYGVPVSFDIIAA